ncbi:MAG TPA: DsbA family oxidoreductase [Atopostipes sp.]|nr:DsbA family oxidoreductase [Atopostipes sp.]
MKITIWSDFVCPFCYIGATHLEKALENFEHADEVEIEYKSFQLEPGATYEPEKTYLQAMIDRKNASEAQMQQMLDQVDEMASNAGLNYNFDDMKLTDTFPAHRVFQYAKEEGKGYEYYDKLYEAFFLNGELISDAEVLKRISSEIGLDEDRVGEILDNEKAYDKEVVLDIYEASQVGVQGVPFFVFNNKYGVSGAQPVEVFEQVLTQVHEEFAEN